MAGLELRGLKLTLRVWQPMDVARATEWANDPESLRAEDRWDPYKPWTADEVENAWRIISTRGWAFIARRGRTAVGEFILTLNGPEPGTGRIDLNVAPRYRRQGVAKEGVALCAVFAFETLCLQSIYGFVEPDNRASIALHHALGYRQRNAEDRQPFVLANTPSIMRRLRQVLRA